MPCYTIQTVSVALKIADMDLMEKAIRGLFGKDQYSVERSGEFLSWNYGRESFNKVTSELRIRNASDAALIKQAYAAEIVKQQAKRFGWTLKEKSQFNYVVVKR